MKEYRLGDIITIKHGYAFDGEHIVQEDNGIVLVTPGNFRIGGGFQEEKCKFYSGEIPDGYVLSSGDFIVTMTDLSKTIDTLGYSALVPESDNRVYLHNQRIGLVSFKANDCFPGYIYFLMRTHPYQRFIANTSTGSTVHHTSPSKIYDYRFYAPGYEEQREIAERMFAYEKTIKNNQRQIKLLEEAAQRLYKEWFVNFRFPGYEDTPIVDGVPEGWEKVPVGNLISYEIGGGWGEETPTGKCIREAYVIRGTDLYGIAHGDLLSIPFRYHVESNLSSRKLKDGDIVFEVSGGSRTEGVARCLLITSSMLNVWRKDVMCASFCKLIRPQFGFSQYLHDCIKHLRATGKTEEYDKRSASSIVNYRWKDFLSQALVLRPSEEILDHYNGVAKEIYSKAINCSLQIESAKKARDRLLPKLMSGEIEV